MGNAQKASYPAGFLDSVWNRPAGAISAQNYCIKINLVLPTKSLILDILGDW
jgi:hypothetical protein